MKRAIVERTGNVLRREEKPVPGGGDAKARVADRRTASAGEKKGNRFEKKSDLRETNFSVDRKEERRASRGCFCPKKRTRRATTGGM